MKIKVSEVQDFLQSQKLDGWLIYDFHHINSIAYELTGLSGMQTRRWYLFIPSRGEAVALIHQIEKENYPELDVPKMTYVGWHDMEAKLSQLLKGSRVVAMEYSPRSSIPYVSKVDAGMLELIKEMGVEVVTSANLVQYFEARWDHNLYQTHKYAAGELMKIKDETFDMVAQKLAKGEELSEYSVQQWVMECYRRHGLVSTEAPIVAVNANASNPHYNPTKEIHQPIKKGDLLLLDIWARKDMAKSAYADITWMAYAGEEVPQKYNELFAVVKGARDKAVEFIKEKVKQGEKVYGWQVDDVTRGFIKSKGYADYFFHRTGHSLGITDVHGNGVNMDNLETKDERELIPGVGFTIEPGVYLPEFGVRSEIDVFMGKEGVEVTTAPPQEAIIPLFAR